MMGLTLPLPKHVEEPEAEDPSAMAPPRPVVKPPPQGQRKGWIPRSLADFGGGGAFPEVHVAQYPLGMGRKGQSASQTLALTTDAAGKARHDVIATVGQREGKVVHSTKDALTAKQLSAEQLEKPSDQVAAENSERTRLALEAMVKGKAEGVHGSLERALADKKEPTYIRYQSSSAGGAQASGATNRVIRMVEAPVDPMEPPKFKHKRVPRGPPSPPAPVMHSPPRKITVQDQQDWKIPPCISNWKNLKGYTIPLDKRLAADGRNMQEVQISDNFAKLSESLYVAERSAREEVEKRAHIQKRIAAKEKESKEDELRLLAQRAREERHAAPPPPPPPPPRSTAPPGHSDGDYGAGGGEYGGGYGGAGAGGGGRGEFEDEGEREREELRRERKRERERERRLETRDGKRSKGGREEERDISERIALGQAAPTSSETLYDQRLFNQSAGVASGFTGEDDAYNIYDKALFKGGAAAEAIYRPSRSTADDGWGDETAAMERVSKAARFQPGDRAGDRGFEGAKGGGGGGGGGGRPVEFEQESAADPFGLDEFLTEARASKK